MGRVGESVHGRPKKEVGLATPDAAPAAQDSAGVWVVRGWVDGRVCGRV